MILGSGGHTREMSTLVQIIERRDPIFVHAEHDTLSPVLLKKRYPTSEYVPITRSREVKQSYLSAIFPTLVALAQSFSVLLKTRPNLILSNGPGTALPLIVVCRLLVYLNILDCKIIFVESYCRIRSLSLTGKLARPFVDVFVVPRPSIRERGVRYINLYPM